ncbi:hypothetical protein [Aquimarina latercula]|uniref:hypothetical protein n=1 Tax=Aquimarina latercula TaxID=987 RepID=UPI0003FA312C|nr:hypothetical protein [Aquimarina latercula]
MKKIIVTLAISLILIPIQAQEECKEIIAQSELLKKEIIALKNILLLTKPKAEIKSKDIQVKLLSVTGETREQSVKIEVLFTNSGVNIDRMSTSVKSIIEAGGNEVLLHKAFLGATEVKGFFGASTALYRDTPLKCTYIFKGVVPETTIIKGFPLPFKYHKEGTRSSDMIEDRVIFNDIKIEWSK